MALIEIRGLSKLYRMGTSIVHALDGVDLNIEEGEFVAITGPSGSGKSTMMHLLGCLDRPTSGRFTFAGRDVGNLSDRQLAEIRNRQIGFVFQTFNLMNRTSALENVAVPLFYARQRNTFAPARVAIERVGLTDRAHHRSNELSGGERQRVAIARAIVNNPLLVLADEPTGNLDSHTGQQIMELFKALNAQGVTVVLVTHEQDVAVQTRRIVHMRDGKIISDRPTAEVVRRDDELRQKGTLVTSAGPVALARPAAAATPVAEQVEKPVTGRLMRGANAALICSLIGPLLFGLVWLAGKLLMRGVDVQALKTLTPGQMPPASVLYAGIIGIAGALAALVMAVITIYLAVSVRRRIRFELGEWRGNWRALIALVLAILTVLYPVAGLVIGLVRGLHT